MSSYQRYSPPTYSRRSDRASVGYYPPSYDDRAGRAGYSSPRASNERVGKNITTLAVEEKYDKNGRLISHYRDPTASPPASAGLPQKRLSLSSYPARIPDSRQLPVVSQHRESTSSSRPFDKYDGGAYYANPASSTGYGQHRHSTSIDDPIRIAGYDTINKRRDTIDAIPSRDKDSRGERRGYHLSGADPRESRPDERYSREYDPYERTQDSGYRRRERRASDAGSRERPQSMIADSYGRFAGGPPPTTRGLDKISGITRHQSVRDMPVRSPPRQRDAPRYPPYDDADYPVQRRRPQPPPDSLDRAGQSTSKADADNRDSARHGDLYHDTELSSRGFGVMVPKDHVFDREAEIDRRAILPAGTLPQRERDIEHEAHSRREPAKMPDFDGQSRPQEEVLKRSERRADRDADLYDREATNKRGARKENDAIPIAGAAALGAAAVASSDYSRSSRSSGPSDSGILQREKYVNPHDSRRTSPPQENGTAIDQGEDDEYMQRLQREMERARKPKSAGQTNGHYDEEKPRRPRDDNAAGRNPDYQPPQFDDDVRGGHTKHPSDDSQALASYKKPTTEGMLEQPFSEEPGTMDERESRVRIVEPPKEKEKPKSILRKPTNKFPEYPDEPRVAVTPHKDSPVAEAPEGSTHTRILRSYVNPQALEEAGERYIEERDHVVVLRVVTKEQVDKLVERTKKIREEYDRRHHERGGRGDEKGSDEDDRRERRHRDRERERRANEEEEEEPERRHRRHKHDDEDEGGHDESERRHRHRRRRRHHDRNNDEEDDDDVDDYDEKRPKAIEY